jgi:hypothetical protein
MRVYMKILKNIYKRYIDAKANNINIFKNSYENKIKKKKRSKIFPQCSAYIYYIDIYLASFSL